MRGKPFEEVRYLRLSRVVEQYIEVQEYKLDLNKLAVFQGNKDYIVNDWKNQPILDLRSHSSMDLHHNLHPTSATLQWYRSHSNYWTCLCSSIKYYNWFRKALNLFYQASEDIRNCKKSKIEKWVVYIKNNRMMMLQLHLIDFRFSRFAFCLFEDIRHSFNLSKMRISAT